MKSEPVKCLMSVVSIYRSAHSVSRLRGQNSKVVHSVNRLGLVFTPGPGELQGVLVFVVSQNVFDQ